MHKVRCAVGGDERAVWIVDATAAHTPTPR